MPEYLARNPELQLEVEKGVYVVSKDIGGPADKAGIDAGDVILSIDGVEVETGQGLIEIISEHWEPGEVPSREQWDDFKKNLEQHPSTIMLWEGEPSDKVTSSLFELGVKSIVYNPCGNTPSKGDFISVMKNNINGFKSLITDP